MVLNLNIYFMLTVLSTKISRINSARLKKQGRESLAKKLDVLLEEEFYWIGNMKGRNYSLQMVCHFFNTLDTFFQNMSKNEKVVIPGPLREVRLNTLRRLDGVWRARDFEKATLNNLYFGGLNNKPFLQIGLIMKLSRERKDQESSFGIMSDYEFYRDKVIEPFLKTQFDLIVKARQALEV